MIRIILSFFFVLTCYTINAFCLEQIEGQYVIKGRNNTYVSYDNGSLRLGNFSQKVIVTIEKIQNGFALKLPDNNYICAWDDGNSITVQPHVGSWESFTIEEASDNEYFIKSHHDKYLRTNFHNGSFDQSDYRLDWETLELLKVGNRNSHSKRFLHVLLHGLGGSAEQMQEQFLPPFFETYKRANPEADMNAFGAQFELFCPQGTHDRWFEIPNLNQFPELMVKAFFPGGVTDSLPEFRGNLTWLRSEIEKRLIQLGLSYGDVVFSGQSMGAITSLTLALESPEPVLAVLGGIGMWMPCEINSVPKHIFLSNGCKDDVIPYYYSNLTQFYLNQYIYNKTNLVIQDFPDDGHWVSQSQIEAMVKFLNQNNIFG